VTASYPPDKPRPRLRTRASYGPALAQSPAAAAAADTLRVPNAPTQQQRSRPLHPRGRLPHSRGAASEASAPRRPPRRPPAFARDASASALTTATAEPGARRPAAGDHHGRKAGASRSRGSDSSCSPAESLRRAARDARFCPPSGSRGLPGSFVFSRSTVDRLGPRSEPGMCGLERGHSRTHAEVRALGASVHRRLRPEFDLWKWVAKFGASCCAQSARGVIISRCLPRRADSSR
jgi:hypothetical protein